MHQLSNHVIGNFQMWQKHPTERSLSSANIDRLFSSSKFVLHGTFLQRVKSSFQSGIFLQRVQSSLESSLVFDWQRAKRQRAKTSTSKKTATVFLLVGLVDLDESSLFWPCVLIMLFSFLLESPGYCVQYMVNTKSLRRQQ